MKIFCIGFNKCGTSSLNQFFLGYGFKSIHKYDWWYWKDMEKFKNTDCFTDGYERYNNKPTYPDLEFLESYFKDCKFILQTRNLKDWLSSRYFQGSYSYLTGFENKKKIDDEVILRWITDRNYWYKKVYDYFKNKDNLLILNLYDDNKEQKIIKFLNMKDKGVIFKQEHISKKSKKTLTPNLNKTQCKEIIIDFLKKYVEEKFWDTDNICPLIKQKKNKKNKKKNNKSLS